MDRERLLIVEDNEDIRTQLRYALQGQYHVSLAGTRQEAVALVRELAPSVVTLDLGLPPEPDLDRVKRVVKLLGMVNSAPDFGQQPEVINGASDLLVQLYGDAGRHARSAVGMGALPRGISVEIEMILEVE